MKNQPPAERNKLFGKDFADLSITTEHFFMKKAFSLLVITLSFLYGHAQDIIQKTNKTKIEVKIIEIGTDEIKYKNYNDLEGPIYILSKREVLSIQLENGKVIEFEKDILEVSESKNSHKRRAIMVAPFAPILDHVALGYQQWISPAWIIDVRAGMIGLGISRDKRFGGFLSAGTKMMFNQLTYSKGTRIVHPLAGAYFMPQLCLSYIQNQQEVYVDFPSSYPPDEPITAKFDNWSGAIHLTIGKQWLIADLILLDLFAGAGYSITNNKIKQPLPYPYSYEVYPTHYFHSHAVAEINPKVFASFTAGVSVGMLLK